MTKQETKPNNQTDVNSAERTAEIEEASAGLDTSVLAQKATKLSKWQIDGIRDYKRVGLTLREVAKQLRLPPATIYHYFKGAPGPVVIEKDSPGPSKLGQTPVVPLENNGTGTSVVVTQELKEQKESDGAQSTQTSLSSANNGGVEVRQKEIDQQFPIDTREKITIKIDPDFILDVRGYMQHSGFKGNTNDMRKFWTEVVVPRLEAMRVAEEYYDFPTEGDPRTRVSDWTGKFKFHMDNSIKYLQAVDELKKEAVKKNITRGVN